MALFRASAILSFQRWPDIKEKIDFGDEVADLVRISEPALAACAPEVEMGANEPEWTRLKTSFSARSVALDTMTGETAYKEEGARCPNLFTLVDYLLTLPSSSVDAERGISSMKQIKNDWRSRLGDCNLSDLMMVSMETPSVDQFDPMPTIHHWNSGLKRAKRPFYKDDMKYCSPTQTHILLDEAGSFMEPADINADDDDCDVDADFDVNVAADSSDDDDYASYRDVTAFQEKAYEMLINQMI
ncbi:PREDICTED: zinc finger protein 862-like [Priapulus caudatus]|uniref:Zinc finger protein 862-like n=1 Tax=Priapulus caudatus TaxID=37621 RepID=A0ABM1F248_PRICU|nr:PREDICTED: zinc finger protein 862-like [Priapulus caudatus]